MKIRAAFCLLVLWSMSAAADDSTVNVGCNVYVGDQLAYQASQFAHQPYVTDVTGKNAAGADRHFQFGVSFDQGSFAASVSDNDHQIDRGGYTTSSQLGSAQVNLAAPNVLNLSVGDSSDVVVKVTCTLSAEAP